MCALAYLRTDYADSTCSISFLMGKTKVAPIRQKAYLKLELAAAVIGVRVAFFIKQKLDVTIGKTHSGQTAQPHYNRFTTPKKDTKCM